MALIYLSIAKLRFMYELTVAYSCERMVNLRMMFVEVKKNV